jgi:hypothetical protein
MNDDADNSEERGGQDSKDERVSVLPVSPAGGETSGLGSGVEARLVDRIKAAKDKAVTATRELLSKVVQRIRKILRLDS